MQNYSPEIPDNFVKFSQQNYRFAMPYTRILINKTIFVYLKNS